MSASQPKLGPLYLPALRGGIGKWVYYCAIMKFSDAAERIKPVGDIYENSELSDMIQRITRDARTINIASYLEREEERFFSSLVVGVYEGEPNWHEFAIEKSLTNTAPLPPSLNLRAINSFGFLSLNGEEKLFPLDGQHRLAGIRRALSSSSDILSDDEVSVLMVAHKDSPEGRQRSRRLFTVLNRRAVPVKRHEIIALDEDDVMAIATRYLTERHEYLSQEGRIAVKAGAAIEVDDDIAFIAIATVYEILLQLFKSLTGTIKQSVFTDKRPSEQWVDMYCQIAATYFDALAETFHEVMDCFKSNPHSKIIRRYRHSNGGHILFRPVGLRLYADLVSEYIKLEYPMKIDHYKDYDPKIKRRVIRRLRRAVLEFQDIPVELEKSPYHYLFWRPETKSMLSTRRGLVRDILLHRYGLLPKKKVDRLERRIVGALGEGFTLSQFVSS